MTENQARQLLGNFLTDLASSLGFSRMDAYLRFSRLEHDATAILSFPLRISTQGIGWFTAGIGLRFEALAVWLDDNPAEIRPTLGRSINMLREDKSYIEWEFANASDLEKLRGPILDDLKKHALPFIEHYSRLAELRKTLESSDKKDWIGVGLSVDTRVPTLAAIQLSEGDKAGAVKTLDDGIKALEESLADKSPELRKRELRRRGFEMRYLHERLLVNA